jgi:hypothetical protein
MTAAAKATAEKKTVVIDRSERRRGDAAPVLQAAEHDLDATASPVAPLVVYDRFVARSAARDAGLDAFGFQSVPEPVGVAAAVAEQPLRLTHRQHDCD